MELVSRKQNPPTCIALCNGLFLTFGGFSEAWPIFVDRDYYFISAIEFSNIGAIVVNAPLKKYCMPSHDSPQFGITGPIRLLYTSTCRIKSDKVYAYLKQVRNTNYN